MKEDCRNDCVEKSPFPRPIHNRAGLSHIHYRIGSYAHFRQALLGGLDKEPLLANWTHREPDDPGIALLEGAAIVGDILTFYQELYANEAYIRTAQWRESIADLVRLTGYRLSPGVGGKSLFAFEVKTKTGKSITIPAGFPIKAQLTGQDKAADFETLKALEAQPALGKFNLYRPRQAQADIAAGMDHLEIQSVNGLLDATSITSAPLKPGDLVMLVPNSDMFDVSGTAYSTQKLPEILVVKEVKTILDRTAIYFEGALTQSWGQGATAYRIGRSFRHFGYNAPANIVEYDDTAKTVDFIPTQFHRYVGGTHYGTGAGAAYYTPLSHYRMPLDMEVDDLAAGGKLICRGHAKFSGQSTPVPFTVVKKLQAAAPTPSPGGP